MLLQANIGGVLYGTNRRVNVRQTLRVGAARVRTKCPRSRANAHFRLHDSGGAMGAGSGCPEAIKEYPERAPLSARSQFFHTSLQTGHSRFTKPARDLLPTMVLSINFPL